MFLLGLLRALVSKAQTPMTPRGAFFRSSLVVVDLVLSLPGLALLVTFAPLILRCVLVRLLDRVTD
jgi:hypothetical protein